MVSILFPFPIYALDRNLLILLWLAIQFPFPPLRGGTGTE